MGEIYMVSGAKTDLSEWEETGVTFFRMKADRDCKKCLGTGENLRLCKCILKKIPKEISRLYPSVEYIKNDPGCVTVNLTNQQNNGGGA